MIAQTMPTEGFYRVHNNGTNHYIRVEDNTGSIIVQTMSADMGAIQLWDGLEQNLDKPSSIIFCRQVGTNMFDLQSQGTGVFDIVNHYVQLTGDYPIYQVYASEAGVTLYLGDSGTNNAFGYHNLTTNANIPPANKRWVVEKVDSNTDNYLGITPTLSANGKYYAPFYASFAFSFASSGMKAYSINIVDEDIAVLNEITYSMVPAGTPCIIECSSTDKSQNRLNVIPADNINVEGNLLAGNYFSNEFRPSSPDALKQFNPSTMRVFNIENGKLVLNTDVSTLHRSTLPDLYPGEYEDNGERYLNSNSSYLPVAAGTPSTLKIMTKAEYDDYKSEKLVQSITLNNTEVSLYPNEHVQLTATISPENATNPAISWTSSNTDVATVLATGYVTAVSEGTAVITANSTDGSGVSASCTVTVLHNTVYVDGITLSETSAELHEGETKQLTATVSPENADNKTVTWTSSNAAIATVSETGLVTAKAEGNAVITATSNDGTNISASCNVTVLKNEILITSLTLSDTSAELNEGETLQITATIAPENADNKELAWTSSNPSVATVNSTGLVTAKTEGTATIRAITTDGSGLSATCDITVIHQVVPVSNIAINPTNADLFEGETIQLSAVVTPENADDKSVTWNSSDATIASVDQTGLVTALGIGSTTITATANDGSNVYGTCTITITVDGIMQIKATDGSQLYYSIDGKARQSLGKGINVIRTASGKVIKVIKK